MGWYFVTKTIRGVPYRYRQRSWREGGKVRTECQCLGPAGNTDTTVTERRVNNPFESSNTTYIPTRHGGLVEPVNTPEEPDWVPRARFRKRLEEVRRQALWDSVKDHEPGTLPINWDRLPVLNKRRNTTSRKFPGGVLFKGDFSHWKINPLSLAREYESLCHNMAQLGIDWVEVPLIVIRQAKNIGWHKAWFKVRTYVVTLQADGGRSKFKRAYREALAGVFLEELRRQSKPLYKKITGLCS